jgi:CDP-glycerol glycerophosphotransferase (TagB/SpsB family)
MLLRGRSRLGGSAGATTAAARALSTLPADPRRIVYNSFQGRFSDNPRAIYEELVRRTNGVSHVWTARERTLAAFPASTRPVVQGSWRHARRSNARATWWPMWRCASTCSAVAA